MDNTDKSELIKYRIIQAKETLAEIEVLFLNKQTSAANRMV